MKLIKLFSLLILALSVATAQELSENISIRVKVIGEIDVDKPPIYPPEKINTDIKLEVLELSPILLEPPKKLEKVDVKKPEGGNFSCGEPKDRINYRKGVKEYLEGNYPEARDYLLNVFSINISPFKPMASYILGVMYAEKGREEKALEFFKVGCDYLNLYRDASCESYYAYSFRAKGSPVPSSGEFPLWEEVYRIKSGDKAVTSDCSNVVYKRYCAYVNRFINGEIDEEYLESSRIRRAILVLDKNPDESISILKEYIKPLNRYRDIALYYYSLALIKKGKIKEAIKSISILETLNSEYSKNLYGLIAKENLGYTLLAYRLTGNKELLNIAGTIAYNRGDYRLAMDFFEKSGNLRHALYSSLRLKDYKTALSVLKRETVKDREHFLWTLETLLQMKDYDSLGKVLEEIREIYPGLYRDYAGWYFFKKKDWNRAAEFLPDGYLRAVALYNSGQYEKVMEALGNPKNEEERLLLARAFISLGKGKEARVFLGESSDEDIYLRGISYFIEGEYEKAIESFSMLGSESPYRVRALLKIADSYYNMGDLENAKRIYMGLLKSFPDSEEAKEATLALVQVELQNPSSDLKTLIPKFIEQFPDSSLIPDLYYQLANTYLKEGDVENAKRVFRVLSQYENYRGKSLLKLAELEDSPEEKEKILLEVIEIGNQKDKDKAVEMLKGLYKKEGEKEKLAQLLLNGGFEDKKEALDIYAEIDIEKAEELLQELVKKNKGDEKITKTALLLFKKTGKPYYLKVARNSPDKEVKAEALYLMGKHLKRKKKNREALESFLEVIISSKGIQPYYNNSIFEAVELLISMKARSDASCLLERLDKEHLTNEQVRKVKMLKEKLPDCKKKQGG